MSWTQKPEVPVPRPKTGVTPIRHVRISDDRWNALQEIAEDEGTRPSALVNEGVDRVIANRRRSRPVRRDDRD